MTRGAWLSALISLCLLSQWAFANQGEYQTTQAFLSEAFKGDPPEPQRLWLQGDLREICQHILGHPYSRLRVKYWQQEARTAWILEEIGKEKPITVGLIINADKMEAIKVLAFRESRGWEVKHPFFTDQFNGISLAEDQILDAHIDGISGATLSVRALKKLARMALYLNRHVQAKK